MTFFMVLKTKVEKEFLQKITRFIIRSTELKHNLDFKKSFLLGMNHEMILNCCYHINA